MPKRLVSIDLLRGIAAFAVVLFHVYGTSFKSHPAFWTEGFSTWLLVIPSLGFTGVYLFFVISGFCIHLRWAKGNANRTNPDISFIAFWKRRWIRLYPAYIAAIVLYVGWQYHNLTFDAHFAWDIVSHLLMIHSFDASTVFSLNGVFWTLAIEEQLYLLYFILLWMRKRYGWGVTLGVCFMARFVWLGISLGARRYGYELPFNEGALANWFIWALGAYAVEAYFEGRRLLSSPAVAAVLFALCSVMTYAGATAMAGSWTSRTSILFTPLMWGVTYFTVINVMVAAEERLPRITLAGAFVGLFSYSLYLTHEVVIEALTGSGAVIICSASLVFAYVFYLAFERPTMRYLERVK